MGSATLVIHENQQDGNPTFLPSLYLSIKIAMMPEYLLALPLRPTLSFLITLYWLAKLIFTPFLWEQHLFHNTFLYLIIYCHFNLPLFLCKFLEIMLLVSNLYLNYYVFNHSSSFLRSSIPTSSHQPSPICPSQYPLPKQINKVIPCIS